MDVKPKTRYGRGRYERSDAPNNKGTKATRKIAGQHQEWKTIPKMDLIICRMHSIGYYEFRLKGHGWKRCTLLNDRGFA